MVNDEDSSQSNDDDSSIRSNSPDTYVPYRTRPEWADVEPISIKTKTSIMDIKYTPRYEEAFGYFRAMLVRDELSERSLELTADCIELQTSNFSVWYFRRRILRALTRHLNDELAFSGKVIESEPKNYQVWHHRKTIVEWLRDPSQDKSLTASVLFIDSKNYHAWQHRQWLIKEFGLWDGELEFTSEHLAKDFRNNSAWNHRFFVIKETRLYEDKSWVRKELEEIVYKKIELCLSNESSWLYLRGMLKLTFGSLLEGRNFCEKLLKKDTSNCQVLPHLLAFILDIIQEDLTNSTTELERNTLKERANDICKTLSETDKVRSKYWKLISKRFVK